MDKEFDLVISTMTLHNLPMSKLDSALCNIERIGKNSLISLESYRSEKELFNLQCWALTCKSFFSSSDWEYLLKKNGFSGDVELLYFE